jgi:Domain of unknown function (4846)
MQNYLIALFVFLLVGCKANIQPKKGETDTAKKNEKIIAENNNEKNVKDIELPIGYERLQYRDSSFGTYLRSIYLKNDATVYLYNGTKKTNQSAQYAVLDVTIGSKDLQQCADAVMRLRAEYLFRLKRFDEIIFYDNEKVKYQLSAPYSRENFDPYLQRVFGMCGTASLAIQLHPKNDLAKMEIGDVFIRGGFPGHAVIIMDIAINTDGEKIFLLAQSYMPAQNIHILKNPSNTELNPWYSIKEIDTFLFTPEYTFTNKELKTW